MSEAALRSSASRGRGSARGGRGGFAGRGGRRTNGDSKPDDTSNGAFDDEGDFAELRAQYGDKTTVIREMFPDWSEVDVLFALQETNGDENEAVTRIAEGNISQWGEVSKAKKAPKKKDDAPATSTNNASPAAPRFARGGRAVSEGRGGRGRGVERGGARGGRGRPAPSPAAAGARKENQQPLSVPTEESPAWGESSSAKPAQPDALETSAPAEPAQPAAPAAKTWASMLRAQQPKPQPPKPKEPVTAPVPDSAEEPTPEPAQPAPEPVDDTAEESTPVAEPAAPVTAEPEVALEPSKTELTETNLEQVVDVSHPPATATAASTAADSWDPRQNQPSTAATPLSASYQQHQASEAPGSGHAASALKATSAARVPSFQRRVLDQEEAVRMPGNREVDRAAVQFGAFNLKDGDDDLDGEREEAETRAQPPVESPIAHPRTSLPPTAQSAGIPESFSQKQAAPSVAPSAPGGAPGFQGNAPSNAQFGRYGQTGPQDGQPPQKPIDPFSQQPTSTQPPFDNFSTPTTQPQTQQPGGAFSSAPSDYSSYYTANQGERNPYNYYGQHFGGHHAGLGQQDNAQSQQRGFGGYSASQADNLSQYPQSGMHNQPRLGSGAADAQNSGHNTPNPTTQSQHQQAVPGSQPQSHGQQYPPYNHPYYNHAYYNQYYSGGYGQAGFGPYGAKGGMYGQPYGMSQNAPFEHGSSPASFNQSSAHRDSGLGSGLGDYGRGGAGQTGGAPGLGGSSFGSMHDSFPRGSSAFQSQSQAFNGQGQAGSNASTDELKPFADGKTASGPSPALGGARPGSATNNGPATQGGLPPPQGSQMGGAYGGYPGQHSHATHGNSGYGMGAGAAGNQPANNPYGSYGQGFGGAGYYGSQQQQQQRGGWGGNYH